MTDGHAGHAGRGPGPYPVPANRGRWTVTLHRRAYSGGLTPADTVITGLSDARGRKLSRAWNTPAAFTFALDGHSPGAAMITELTQDAVAWRWDEQTGRDVAMFRGPITQTADVIDEQSAALTVTCHDYFAMLARRLLTAPVVYTATDQDGIVNDLVMTHATAGATTSGGTVLAPGSYLPLFVQPVGSDATARPFSGVLRDRTYPAHTQIGQLVDDLAHVQGGFDYEVAAVAHGGGTEDVLRLFYPYQGVTRSDVILDYGSTVSGVTRNVNSADYANYVRILGNNGQSDPAYPQRFAEVVDLANANNVSQVPLGLWMYADNAADVTIQATLDDKAAGDLLLMDVVTPTYTVTLRPGAYSYGNPNMGDVVPLIVRAGRLNVTTSVRVVGIDFTVSDDGDETVALTVGRPTRSLADLLYDANQGINALARR